MRLSATSTIGLYLLNNSITWQADLVTITCLDGTVFRLTTFETNLTVSGVTYFAGGGEFGNAPAVSKGAYRQSADCSIDTLDLTLTGPWTFRGKTLGQLAASGFFDSASIQIDKLLMPTPGDVTTLGPITAWFAGQVSQPEPKGYVLTLRCKSGLETLNVKIPRFLLRPQCGNQLYDANCGVSRGACTLAGSVSSATTMTVTTATAALTAKASGYFDFGVLHFISGALADVKAAVASGGWNGSTFTLCAPLIVAPTAGDLFHVYPGCDRSAAICTAKFGNTAQFRGFPSIPRQESGG